MKFVSLDVFTGQPYINSEAYDARTTSCNPVDYDDVRILAAEKVQTDPDFDPAPYDGLNSATWQVFIPFRGDFIIDGTVLLKYLGDASSVVIPEGITEIGPRAFFINKLQEVAFPVSLHTIGVEAFYGSELKSLVIPQDMALTIHACAFDCCDDLQRVEICSERVQFSTHIPGRRNNDTSEHLPFSGCGSATEFILPETFRNKNGWKLFRDTPAVQEVCSTDRSQVHPQYSIFYRLTCFMGDYYLEYDSIYYAEYYTEDKKWGVLPLPKDFPDQWDCGRLADFAEEHNAESWCFDSIAESIRGSLVFRTACFRQLPFVSLPDGAHEMLLNWHKKNYKVPLTAQENVLDEFFACDRDDALDTFRDFDCDYVISSKSDAALETYSQALQHVLGAETVAQLLQCSEANISKNDLLEALYPFRAHLYRDPGKTAVLELDFTVSAEFPGCIRGTAILEPDCLLSRQNISRNNI